MEVTPDITMRTSPQRLPAEVAPVPCAFDGAGSSPRQAWRWS